MKRLAYLALAMLAEVLSWPCIVVGFVAGVCVLALVTAYERGRWGYPMVTVREDEDGD